MANAAEAKKLRQQLLAPRSPILPPVPTPDVVKAYPRKRIEGGLGKKGRAEKASQLLSETPSLIEPDASVLASVPEVLWQTLNTGGFHPIRRIERSRQLREQAAERRATFNTVHGEEVTQAAQIATQVIGERAKASAEMYGSDIKSKEGRAYQVASLINALADNPQAVLQQRIDHIRATLPPVAKIAMKQLGRVLPGKDPIERLSDMIESNDQIGQAAELVRGIMTTARQNIVTDHAHSMYISERHVNDPSVQLVHDGFAKGLKTLGKKVALPLLLTGVARIAPPAEGLLGQVAEGFAADKLVKMAGKHAPRAVELAAQVAFDRLTGKTGSAASLHMVEFVLSVVAPDLQVSGLSGHVTDYLFEKYAATQPGETAALIRPAYEEHLFGVAERTDKRVAAIGRAARRSAPKEIGRAVSAGQAEYDRASLRRARTS